MAAPTDNDWNAFKSERFNTKVEVLLQYVCYGAGNMQEIAQHCMGGAENSQRVSSILRCYGFGGRNQGALRNYPVQRSDVEAFVKKYKNGARYDEVGSEFCNFIKNRVAKRAGSSGRGNNVNPVPNGGFDSGSNGGGFDPNAGGRSGSGEGVYIVLALIAIFVIWKFRHAIFAAIKFGVSAVITICVVGVIILIVLKLFGRR